MKKTLLLSAMAFMAIVALNAQDVIKLGVNDDIKTTLAAYTGTNVVLVIPAGYTNPQSVPTATTAGTPPVTTYSWSLMDLSTLTNTTSSTKITIKGDGSNPTLTLKTIVLPAALSRITLKDLTITGIEPLSKVPGNVVDPTVNYIFNQGAAVPTVVDSIVLDNCNISTFRSLVRFQSTAAVTAPTQRANNVIINNCVVSNFADYGVVYNSTTGGYFGPVKVMKSTFYGLGATVFMLQKNSTSIGISDCTFDNVVGASAKALVDLSTLVAPVTITNCILGKTQLASGGLTIKTAGTLTITNCYSTTDWTAATSTATAGITGSFTAYNGASTDLFSSVSVSSAAAAGPPATPYMTTVGNYKIKDAAFAGKNSVGDPRWYYNSTLAVNQVLSDKGISFNGTVVINTQGLDIEVYSVLGKKVATSKTNISTANFQKGIYVVRASGSNDSMKIII